MDLSSPIDTDVATLQVSENKVNIDPKFNWLVSGVNQVREIILKYESGRFQRVTLNPTKDQLYSIPIQYNYEKF